MTAPLEIHKALEVAIANEWVNGENRNFVKMFYDKFPDIGNIKSDSFKPETEKTQFIEDAPKVQQILSQCKVKF